MATNHRGGPADDRRTARIILGAYARWAGGSRFSGNFALRAGQGWVLSPINVLPWHWLSQAFQKSGEFPPRVAFETRSVRLRLQIVAMSRHLGFLAKRVIRQAASQFQLKELPVKDATWLRPIGIIHRKDAYLSPVAMHFIEALKAIAKRG